MNLVVNNYMVKDMGRREGGGGGGVQGSILSSMKPEMFLLPTSIWTLH